MNTNRVKRFAGLLVALTVATTTAISGNNPGRVRCNGTCFNQISNLSVDQKDQISKLRTEHQKNMDQLREKRRSTVDVSVKNQIGEEMNAENQKYRTIVKSLLTPDQQNQFTSQGKGKNQGRGNGSCGKGKGKGKGNGTGKAYGTGICRQL